MPDSPQSSPFFFKVPSGRAWVIVSVWVSITTDAVAGPRLCRLLCSDPQALVLADYWTVQSQGPSLGSFVMFGLGLGTAGASVATLPSNVVVNQVAIAPLCLIPGSFIGVELFGDDPGDVFQGGPRMVVAQYDYGAQGGGSDQALLPTPILE